jgi:hypothetical protein
MRAPIPDRIKPSYLAVVILFIFVAQELAGTNVLFALLIAVYIALWGTAFNLSGGLRYPSGSFIFANGLLSVVVGFGAKALLFQRGESNLKDPISTMVCYCVGMAGMLVVAYLVQSLRSRLPLLPGFDSNEELNRASIICLVVGIGLIALFSNSIFTSEGSLLSALRQINGFPVMSILLATTYQIHHSKGARSVNWVVVVGIAINVAYGLVFFGKQGMFIGFLAWFMAAALQDYDFKPKQIIGLTLGLAFMIYYLVPYSQYVRVYGSRTGSTRENIPIALEYLSDLSRTRQLYLDTISDYDVLDEAHLYDKREGFLDRLIIVAADDQLIDYTNHGHVFGLTPMYTAYANIIPHFLWKNKPSLNGGNAYAHELGGVADEDTTTGVSFSATADAFHEASWLGLLLLMPVNLFICFLTIDSVAGSARYSQFAMLPIIQMFTIGSDTGLGTSVYLATYGILSLFVISYTTKTAGPFVINLFRPRRIQTNQAATTTG